MAFALPVWRSSGLQSIAVPVNGNSRVDVYDAADVAAEIVNSPDAAPNLGGKFPVYDADDTEWPISFQSVTTPGEGDVIEEFIELTPGEAVQGGWTR